MEVREPSAKYLARAAYKQTDVGMIPEGWEVGSLVNFWSVTDCKHVTAQFVRSGYPLASIKEVQSRFVDLTNAKHTTLRVYNVLIEGGRKPRAGDLIVSRNATVGEVAQVAEWHPPFAMGQDVVLLRKRMPEFSTRFLQAVFRSSVIASQLSDLMVGSTFKRANVKQIKSFVVPMPPASEQQDIAEALSDADTLIEALEQLLAKKRQIKQGAMQELLTGQRRLPGFTGEWDVKPMGELFEFSGGLTASRDQLGEDGYCYLHYGDIHMSSKTYLDVRAEFHEIPKLKIPLKQVGRASLLSDGDVVFVDASEDDEGTSKHMVVVNPDGVAFISGLHTIVAKGKAGELDNGYKRYCFQTEAVKTQFRYFAVGTKVSGVSKTNIAKIDIAVPSIEEQTAIAAVLSDMDADIAAIEVKLAKARQIKQGMMQELLTGRIRLV